jgi:hypothetical protein
MPAIGMGLAWAGYTGMLWAYCLIRGYDVTLGQLVNPVHQLNWKTATANLSPDTQIVPGGQNAAAAGSQPGRAPLPQGKTGIPGNPRFGSVTTQ